MRKNHIIRKALGNISLMNYENSKEALFNKWCHHHAFMQALPLRALVSNDYIRNWYDDQWVKLVELAFYMDNKDFIESGVYDPDTFIDLFYTYPETLKEIYPKPLFTSIKKQTRQLNPTHD